MLNSSRAYFYSMIFVWILRWRKNGGQESKDNAYRDGYVVGILDFSGGGLVTIIDNIIWFHVIRDVCRNHSMTLCICHVGQALCHEPFHHFIMMTVPSHALWLNHQDEKKIVFWALRAVLGSGDLVSPGATSSFNIRFRCQWHKINLSAHVELLHTYHVSSL